MSRITSHVGIRQVQHSRSLVQDNGGFGVLAFLAAGVTIDVLDRRGSEMFTLAEEAIVVLLAAEIYSFIRQPKARS